MLFQFFFRVVVILWINRYDFIFKKFSYCLLCFLSFISIQSLDIQRTRMSNSVYTRETATPYRFWNFLTCTGNNAYFKLPEFINNSELLCHLHDSRFSSEKQNGSCRASMSQDKMCRNGTFSNKKGKVLATPSYIFLCVLAVPPTGCPTTPGNG